MPITMSPLWSPPLGEMYVIWFYLPKCLIDAWPPALYGLCCWYFKWSKDCRGAEELGSHCRCSFIWCIRRISERKGLDAPRGSISGCTRLLWSPGACCKHLSLKTFQQTAIADQSHCQWLLQIWFPHFTAWIHRESHWIDYLAPQQDSTAWDFTGDPGRPSCCKSWVQKRGFEHYPCCSYTLDRTLPCLSATSWSEATAWTNGWSWWRPPTQRVPCHHRGSCSARKGNRNGWNNQGCSILAFDSDVRSILPLRLGNPHQLELESYRVKKHLEPLARAACITQATHCGLDQVLLIFGSLYNEYSQLKAELGDDGGLIQANLDSIEKHWQKSDQDVFIAALILNPMYKTSPFSRTSSLNHANVFSLLRHL